MGQRVHVNAEQPENEQSHEITAKIQGDLVAKFQQQHKHLTEPCRHDGKSAFRMDAYRGNIVARYL